MAHRVMLYVYRKPGTTPQAFKTHYEDVHVPLVKQMSGNLFPLAHTRRYVLLPEESSNTENNANISVETKSGSPSGLGYDAIMEMTFEDQEAFHKFSGLLAQPENATKIAEDCAVFLDTSRAPHLVVIGDVCETRRD